MYFAFRRIFDFSCKIRRAVTSEFFFFFFFATGWHQKRKKMYRDPSLPVEGSSTCTVYHSPPPSIFRSFVHVSYLVFKCMVWLGVKPDAGFGSCCKFVKIVFEVEGVYFLTCFPCYPQTREDGRDGSAFYISAG